MGGRCVGRALGQAEPAVWEWWAGRGPVPVEYPRHASWGPAVEVASGNGCSPPCPVVKHDIATGAGLGEAVGRAEA